MRLIRSSFKRYLLKSLILSIPLVFFLALSSPSLIFQQYGRVSTEDILQTPGMCAPLNQFKVGGFKLGFWFAQQGSMYCFVALIFIYIAVLCSPAFCRCEPALCHGKYVIKNAFGEKVMYINRPRVNCMCVCYCLMDCYVYCPFTCDICDCFMSCYNLCNPITCCSPWSISSEVKESTGFFVAMLL